MFSMEDCPYRYNGKDYHELLILTMGSNIIPCVSYYKKNTKSSK